MAGGAARPHTVQEGAARCCTRRPSLALRLRGRTHFLRDSLESHTFSWHMGAGETAHLGVETDENDHHAPKT